MLETKKRSKWQLWLVGTGTIAVMAAAAAGARADGLARDRVLSMGEATRLAAAARPSEPDGGIPVTVNELVLAELNRFVGTPEGRASIRDAFARMARYRAMIEAKADGYGLPADLVAVPVAESRYENATWSPGAGLWGFIKSTARRYDLVVEPGRDERLDEAKETEAAMKYFRDLYNIFHDWRLALRAYNEGESHVVALIKKFHTRDAWELERKAESRERYLASVTAILILLKNPDLLR